MDGTNVHKCADQKEGSSPRTSLCESESRGCKELRFIPAFGYSNDPKYLDASQAAWKSYVDANCTVVAALGGGSNSAITDREGACYEKELDLRVAFLREVENESSW